MFKKISKGIRSLILFLWSFSPILAVTNDSNFGTVDCKDKLSDYSENLRISLINLMLGNNIIYFATIQFSTKKGSIISKQTLENFKIFELLSLDTMQQFNVSATEMEKKSSNYLQYINGVGTKIDSKINQKKIRNSDLEIEKNFIIYKIQNEENRIQRSETKVNFYAAICLVLVPIFVTTVNFHRLSYLSIIDIVLCFGCVYSLLNLTLHALHSMKVRGIEKSSFKDFKTCSSHKDQEILNYYKDWQYLRLKADLYVSYVTNIQSWMIFAFIFTIALSVWFSISEPNQICTKQSIETNTISSINIEEIDMDCSKSSDEWSKLDLAIKDNSISCIYFISSNKSVSSILEEKIASFPCNIRIVYLYDETLEGNIYKIYAEE